MFGKNVDLVFGEKRNSTSSRNWDRVGPPGPHVAKFGQSENANRDTSNLARTRLLISPYDVGHKLIILE